MTWSFLPQYTNTQKLSPIPAAFMKENLASEQLSFGSPPPYYDLHQKSSSCTVAPKYTFSSLHHLFSSLHHLFSSPHHLFSSPHHLFSSPHHLFSSLHHLFSSLHHLFEKKGVWRRENFVLWGHCTRGPFVRGCVMGAGSTTSSRRFPLVAASDEPLPRRPLLFLQCLPQYGTLDPTSYQLRAIAHTVRSLCLGLSCSERHTRIT